MGIRETLNNKPKVAAGIGGTALALGVTFLALQLSSGGGPSDEAFFTTDDGKTWFADDATRLPPFQPDGKEAVRAHVFECDDGKRFVNHLERFTPERRKLMEEAARARKEGKPLPRPAAAGQTVMWGQEVKKPGDKEWVPAGNLAKASRILQAKCPDGQDAIPVEP